MKFKKLFLGAFSTAIVAAPMALSVSCNDTKKEAKSFDKLSFDEQKTAVQTAYANLSADQKMDFVKSLDMKKTLSDDQVAKLISVLNKDAAMIGGIIWYIKSVESYIAKDAAYAAAKIAFENLKKRADTDNMDYSQNFNTAQKVVNPASGKSIPVIFMDIDETVLQNDITESYAMLHGGFNMADKEREDVKGLRFALPGVVEFINYVQENGALVAYNSDMSQSTLVRDKVAENLKKAGVKFVQNYQFWMRGSMPYLATNENEITNELTANMSKDELKTLAGKTKFTENFSAKPWRTWDNIAAAETLGKLVYKTDRMNGLDANTEGWNLGAEQAGSGDKVVMKTTMRIGDNYNDFFDRQSKKLTNDEKVKTYLDEDGLRKLFMPEGGEGLKYDTKTKKFVKLGYHQAYIMVPGNAEYGGWTDEYGYGNYYDLWKALQAIQENPKYAQGPSADANGGALRP
ncbi:HAD family acid phosphatase [Mycoplasmopsis felifaucium]|uniref:HAD family acid phosphatase n=1 Tax=Mycoplasmopsis felifaucium TaxID=35768 RepID=A0ABZ2RS00_9BACT